MSSKSIYNRRPAVIQIIIDLMLPKPHDSVSALLQVHSLASILAFRLSSTMPVGAVCEHNHIEVVQDEVHYPSVVHRDLLLERSVSITKHRCHSDLDSGTPRRHPLKRSDAADVRAVVGACAPSRSRPRRELIEQFEADWTDTLDFCFPLGVTLTSCTVLPTPSVGTRLAAKLLGAILRSERSCAPSAGLHGALLVIGLAHRRIMTRLRAVFTTPFPNPSLRKFPRRTAYLTSDNDSPIAWMLTAFGKCHTLIVTQPLEIS